jgi:hypothetical protein
LIRKSVYDCWPLIYIISVICVIFQVVRSGTCAELPDCSWCMTPKPEKMYQMNTKYAVYMYGNK